MSGHGRRARNMENNWSTPNAANVDVIDVEDMWSSNNDEDLSIRLAAKDVSLDSSKLVAGTFPDAGDVMDSQMKREEQLRNYSGSSQSPIDVDAVSSDDIRSIPMLNLPEIENSLSDDDDVVILPSKAEQEAQKKAKKKAKKLEQKTAKARRASAAKGAKIEKQRSMTERREEKQKIFNVKRQEREEKMEKKRTEKQSAAEWIAVRKDFWSNRSRICSPDIKGPGCLATVNGSAVNTKSNPNYGSGFFFCGSCSKFVGKQQCRSLDYIFDAAH
jgi:hypothetical protein